MRYGHSVLVLGEAGMGSAEFAHALFLELRQEFDTAIATYKGSGKKFFADIADQLKIPTTEPKYNREGDEVGEKPLTMDGLKDEIAENIGDRTLLIFPKVSDSPPELGIGWRMRSPRGFGWFVSPWLTHSAIFSLR